MKVMRRRLHSVCPIVAILSLTGCLGYRTPMNDRNAGKHPASPFAKDAGAAPTQEDAPVDILDRYPGADLSAKDLPADLTKDLPADLAKDLPAGLLERDLAADLRGKDVLPDVPNGDGRVDRAPDLAQADLTPDSGHADASPLADCKPGDPYVLVLGANKKLYRFDPSTLALGELASVECGGGNLNSLTASTRGPAYISSQSGDLCTVELANFTSALTAFDPARVSGSAFGMALLSDDSPTGQTLYIAAQDASFNNRLERIGLTKYDLTDIGPILPTVPWAELTAGPAGELYGFAIGTSSSQLLNIDPQTGSAIDVTTVPAGYNGATFALVYWQGDFYLFVGPASSSGTSSAEVYRYRKGNAQVTYLGALPMGIIGAGVAACQ